MPEYDTHAVRASHLHTDGVASDGVQPARSRPAALAAMISAIDNGDVAGILKYMADDVVTRFCNTEPIHGKTAFEDLFGQVFSQIRGVHHDVDALWQAAEDPDVFIAQMMVTYTRLDERHVNLPCCNVFRMRGDGVTEYSVYMDITPVFAPDISE